MYKTTIRFTDYNGNPRKEDFFFNLTKAEVAKLEIGTAGGMQQFLETVGQQQDNAKIIEFFDKMIRMSYGEKSADGKYFLKERNGEKLVDAFVQTEAYSELFMKLMGSSEEATAFFNGVMPQLDPEQLSQREELRKELEARLDPTK